MTHDLSHIYHRPGELFWLECDPFQQAMPCWQAYTQRDLDCGLYGFSNRYR